MNHRLVSYLSKCRIAFFIMGAMLGSPALGGSETKTMELISKLLANPPTSATLEVKKTKKEWEVSFCPDNTCDIIRAPAGTPEETIGDFTFLYIYYVSKSVYLKEFYLKDGRQYISSVLVRNSGSCNQTGEFARAACAMSSLAKRYHFRVGMRTYDEHATVEGFEEFKNSLTEAHIKTTKAWQEGQWKK